MSHLKLDMRQSEGTSPPDPNLVQIWLGERKGRGGVDGERERNLLERETLTSLYFFWQLVRRISARQETKLIPTARATRGYLYCGVLTTPGGRGLLLLGLVLV